MALAQALVLGIPRCYKTGPVDQADLWVPLWFPESTMLQHAKVLAQCISNFRFGLVEASPFQAGSSLEDDRILLLVRSHTLVSSRLL